MRLGFFLGFLIGGVLASLISMFEPDEAGESDGVAAGGPATRFRQAREAGRQAAAEKEAEMLRDWDKSREPVS